METVFVGVEIIWRYCEKSPNVPNRQRAGAHEDATHSSDEQVRPKLRVRNDLPAGNLRMHRLGLWRLIKATLRRLGVTK